jgi:hypothetical protein
VSTAITKLTTAPAVGRLRAAAMGAAGLEAAASGGSPADVFAAAEAAADAWDIDHPALAQQIDADAQSTVNIPLNTFVRLLEIEQEAIDVGRRVLAKQQQRKDKTIRLGVFRRLMSLVGMTLPPVEGERGCD